MSLLAQLIVIYEDIENVDILKNMLNECQIIQSHNHNHNHKIGV